MRNKAFQQKDWIFIHKSCFECPRSQYVVYLKTRIKTFITAKLKKSDEYLQIKTRVAANITEYHDIISKLILITKFMMIR